MARPPGALEELALAQQFRKLAQEWSSDHRMFAAALDELAGQLSAVQPPEDGKPRPQAAKQPPSELLQRVMQHAPSDELTAYAAGRLPAGRLQRSLPEQMDQNLRLLGVLAAEMRSLVRRLEVLADGAAALLAGGMGGGSAGGETGSVAADSSSAGNESQGSDAALLMVGVADGMERETELIERAAAGITLLTPSEEVAAAATIIRLEPFLDLSLLAAALQAESAAAAATAEPP